MTQFFGGLLMAIGILVMACSGLCSLLVVVAGFTAVFQDPSIIFLPLLVGGIPFALGYGSFRLGRSLLRQAADRDL